MKVAIVGVRGLPNTYGGFETLAEYLVEYLSNEFDITVYCSSKDMNSKLESYKGAKLKYIPITSHGAFGILYDSVSLLNSIYKYDKILVLGFGGGFVMPFLKKFKSKVILNLGGLDWKRNKWSYISQKIIKKAEELLIKNCGQIVSDNLGIQKYIQNEYDKNSTLIAYGGDQAMKQEITGEALNIYPFLNNEYAFIVTRIQPDNNIDMLLEAFTRQTEIPLVMVGNWDNSPYGRKTKTKYEKRKSLILLDAIYERDKLDTLRSNCTLYVHGHSAGGTNPSLCEAMFLALPIIAFASGYNEYTTDNKALYFHDVRELLQILKKFRSSNLKEIGKEMERIAKEKYVWKNIADQYKELILKDKI